MIENLNNASSKTELYANSLRDDNISALENITGGCNRFVSCAKEEISKYANTLVLESGNTTLNTTDLVDREKVFAKKLSDFKADLETVDKAVKLHISQAGNEYRTDNNIETSWWEDLKYAICDGIHSIMNSTGLGRVISELCRKVGDWFTDLWEDFKEWYAFDGGEFWVNIGLGLLAIAAAVFTILTAGTGFLALVAIIGAVCAIVDAFAKIGANVAGLIQRKEDPAWAHQFAKVSGVSSFGNTLVERNADSIWGRGMQVAGGIVDVVSTACAIIGFADFATKSIDKVTGKTSAFQKYLGSGGIVDTAFIDGSGNNSRILKDGVWYQVDTNGDIALDKLGNPKRVKFSTNNEFSEGAKWKWKTEEETFGQKVSKISTVVKEDVTSMKSNIKTDLGNIKSYVTSFKGQGLKGGVAKIFSDSGKAFATGKNNYFVGEKNIFKNVKTIINTNFSGLSSFGKTAENVKYMRGKSNDVINFIGKASLIGTQLNNVVTTFTQVTNFATGHLTDNWKTTSSWNKMVKGIDRVFDRQNKTLTNYTIPTSTRYDNLNLLFN